MMSFIVFSLQCKNKGLLPTGEEQRPTQTQSKCMINPTAFVLLQISSVF